MGDIADAGYENTASKNVKELDNFDATTRGPHRMCNSKSVPKHLNNHNHLPRRSAGRYSSNKSSRTRHGQEFGENLKLALPQSGWMRRGYLSMVAQCRLCSELNLDFRNDDSFDQRASRMMFRMPCNICSAQ